MTCVFAQILSSKPAPAPGILVPGLANCLQDSPLAYVPILHTIEIRNPIPWHKRDVTKFLINERVEIR